MNEEGEAPVWLTLDQARSGRPTFAVERIIEQYSERLLAAVPRITG